MSILKSKYEDLDIENMSDEEFEKISRKIYIDMSARGGLGILLLIISIAIICSLG